MRYLRLSLGMLVGLVLIMGVASAAERFFSTPGGQKISPQPISDRQAGQPAAVQFSPLPGGQDLPQPQWFRAPLPGLATDGESELREATPSDNGFMMPLVPQHFFAPADPKVRSFAQLAESRGWMRHEINGITYYIMPCAAATH